MNNRDGTSNRLVAAVTVTGAVLWLNNVAADTLPSGLAPDMSRTAHGELSRGQQDKSLSRQLELLHEKLRDTFPATGKGSARQIRNIVQFFNFLNCERDEHGNCK